MSYAAGTVTIEPDAAGETVPLPEGDLNVQVTGYTEAEQSGDSFTSDALPVTVDLTSPEVTSVSLDPASPIYDADGSAETTVTVDFDEALDDGEPNPALDFENGDVSGGFDEYALAEDGESLTATLTLDDGQEASDTIVVNANGAQDAAGNTLDASGDSADTSIEVDTVEPTVELVDAEVENDVNGFDSIEGAISLDDHFTASDADNNELTFEIKEDGADDDTYSAIDTEFDTTTEDDGLYVIRGVVADDNGLSDTDSEKFLVQIDNNDPSASAQNPDSAEDVRGEVTPSDLFQIEDGVVTDFDYAATHDVEAPGNDATETDDGFTLDTSELDDGDYTVEVTVSDIGDEGETVTATTNVVVNNEFDLADDELTVEDGEGEDANDGVYTVTVTTDSPVSELNVTATNDDNYYQDSSTSLTADDFGEGTETDDGNYDYTATWTAPRDGSFDVSVLGATAQDGRTLDDELTEGIVETGGTDVTVDTVVDTGTPTLEHADVIDGGDDSLTVELKFNESLDGVASVEDFNGAGVSVDAEATDYTTGKVTVTVDDEVQTGDATEIITGAVTEQYKADGDDDATSTSADVTYLLSLDEGVNTVSIPAETGSIDLDDVDLTDISGVMTYEDGDWLTAAADDINLRGGNGYTINADSDTELRLNVDNVPAEGAYASEHLENGWNFVGAYQLGTQATQQAMSPLPDSADWTVQEGYTGEQPTQLQDGNGYWLFVNDDSAVHVPVGYDGLQSNQPNIVSATAVDQNEGTTDNTVTTGDTVSVTAVVTDDTGLASVTVDGSALGGEDASSVTLNPIDGEADTYGNTFTADAISASEGTVSLPVTAIDYGGNVKVNTDASVEVEDNQLDTLTLTTPDTSDENVDSFDSAPTITGDVSDSISGVDTVDLTITNSAGDTWAGDSFTTDPTTVSATVNNDGTYSYSGLSGAADDLYTVQVTASDNAGNDKQVSADFRIATTGDLSITGGQLNTPTSPVDRSDSATTTDVQFTVESVSADGDTDTLTLVVPDSIASSTTIADNINEVAVEDSNGETIQVEGSASAVNVDEDGVTEGIQFDIAPDGGGTVDATASVNVDLVYDVSQGDYNFGAEVSDSDSDSDSSANVATIHVDETPTVNSVSADATTSPDTVTVTFSEPIDSTTVENADFSVDVENTGDSNFDKTDITPSGTAVSEDGTQVTLELADGSVLDNANEVRAVVVGDISDADEQGKTVPTGQSTSGAFATTTSITTA